LNTSTEFTFDLNRPVAQRHGTWLDYVEGTAQVMMSRGFRLGGADLLISSNVPVGAGLSSSAALEIATGYALASLAGSDTLNLTALALSAQSAEHRYVGTRCGIMDQFIASFGEVDCALLIDCRSLAHKPVPLSLGSACLLICDTRAKHELASSAYNERRAQCEIAVAMLRAAEPTIGSLRDVSWEQFEAAESALPDLILGVTGGLPLG